MLAAASPALAQQATQQTALRTFLDCQSLYCDFDFLRREITWVDWVRDRQTAQVHLLITRQTTGGGGAEYTLRFLGVGPFDGRNQEFKAFTAQSASDDDVRRALAEAMKLGLTGYAAAVGMGPRLSVAYQPPDTTAPLVQQVDDPWNYWVFRVGFNGFFQGQSLTNFSNLNGSTSATRTTDDLKLRFSVRGSRNSSDFTLSDESKVSTSTSSYGIDALSAWSLGDHWSLGVQGGIDHSDTRNLDRSFKVAPGIEYNVFRYDESTRRQLTFLYEIGVTAFTYQDTTIFNRLTETLPNQRLTVSLVSREPWGSANASISGSSYLRDVKENNIQFSGGVSLRVVKGLQLNVSGYYARIRDQLFLSKAGATDEEILLRLRQLETSYEYFISLGFSYTFGSVFNNIVNPRFGGSGGGGQFFFF